MLALGLSVTPTYCDKFLFLKALIELTISLLIMLISQGPKVSDEKLREMCSAVVEGGFFFFIFNLLHLYNFFSPKILSLIYTEDIPCCCVMMYSLFM